MTQKDGTDWHLPGSRPSALALAAIVAILALAPPGCTKWVLREGDGAVDAWVPPDDGGDAGPDADADLDVDDRAVDSGPPCPEGMVLIESGLAEVVCIDAYEASCGEEPCHRDNERLIPQSVAGEQPWVEIPWTKASLACQRAGKTLCTAEQWRVACSGGTENLPYPYGDRFSKTICNDRELGLSIQNTGALGGCEGGFPGIFDMSGNVKELVDDCDDDGNCLHMGGAYNDPEAFLGCHPERMRRITEDEWVGDVGFRCCLVIP